MSNIDGGGPAFPMSTVDSQTGMTLREWFAGQALAGLCVNENYITITPERLARFAYMRADAMIAEGSNKDGAE